MSRIDRLKEEIGWLKVVFVALVPADALLLGWLAGNYDSASQLLVVYASIGVAFTTTIVVWINRAALRRFEALEDE